MLGIYTYGLDRHWTLDMHLVAIIIAALFSIANDIAVLAVRFQL